MATTATFTAPSFGSLPAVRCQRRRTGTDSVPARPCVCPDHGAISGLQQNLSHPVNDRFEITPLIGVPD
jgi:hypothetical protein